MFRSPKFFPTLVLLVFLQTVLQLSSAQGATVLIDFGTTNTNGGKGGPTTGLAQTWNNYTDATGVATLNLFDTSNANTGFVLSTSGSFTSLNEGALPTGAPYPDTAAGDAFFNNAARTITFSNLNPLLTYNIVVYGYVNRADSRLTNVNINGNIQSYEPANVGLGNVDGGFTTFTGLTPNASNQIALTFTTPTGNYILSVIELTSVPEPTYSLLFTMGLATLALHRKRRAR